MKNVWYKYREERGTASSFWTTPNNLLRNSNTGKRDFTKFKVRWVFGKQWTVKHLVDIVSSLVEVCLSTTDWIFSFVEAWIRLLLFAPHFVSQSRVKKL